MYGGRIRTEERTENPPMGLWSRRLSPDFPNAPYLEIIRVGAKDASASLAAQYQNCAQLAHCPQRPANGGTAHPQEPANPADGGKCAICVARLLEQAQAYAESTVAEAPAEDFTG